MEGAKIILASSKLGRGSRKFRVKNVSDAGSRKFRVKNVSDAGSRTTFRVKNVSDAGSRGPERPSESKTCLTRGSKRPFRCLDLIQLETLVRKNKYVFPCDVFVFVSLCCFGNYRNLPMFINNLYQQYLVTDVCHVQLIIWFSSMVLS